MVPAKQKEMKEFLAAYSEKSLGSVNVGQAVGGARDVKCMYWETSLLDAKEVSKGGNGRGGEVYLYIFSKDYANYS